MKRAALCFLAAAAWGCLILIGLALSGQMAW